MEYFPGYFFRTLEIIKIKNQKLCEYTSSCQNETFLTFLIALKTIHKLRMKASLNLL